MKTPPRKRGAHNHSAKPKQNNWGRSDSLIDDFDTPYVAGNQYPRARTLLFRPCTWFRVEHWIGKPRKVCRHNQLWRPYSKSPKAAHVPHASVLPDMKCKKKNTSSLFPTIFLCWYEICGLHFLRHCRVAFESKTQGPWCLFFWPLCFYLSTFGSFFVVRASLDRWIN